MILQALIQYYERMRREQPKAIAEHGFCSQAVTTSLVLGRNGRVIQIRDLCTLERGWRIPSRLIVPERPKGKVGLSIKPAFLCDDTGYVFGIDNRGDPERAREKRSAFIEYHHNLLDGVQDDGARALIRFLDTSSPETAQTLDRWTEWCGSVVVFELEKEGYLHDRAVLRDLWLQKVAESPDTRPGICLVTGRKAPIARLHGPIRGVKGTKGAMVVSFDDPAFCSYGKERGFNAPVGVAAATAYVLALNYLLVSPQHRLQIADATTVFWTAQKSRVEEFMGLVFETSDDAAEVARLREWLDAVRSGHYPKDLDPSVPFYILGLAAPAKSRLSVRFWYAGTVGEMGQRVKRHFDDIAIERLYDNEPEYPGLNWLLLETAGLHDAKNIPETLADAMMRSILTGGRYPASLLPILLSRARAEQAGKDKKTGKPKLNVSYFRAALIKAALVRNYNMEVCMSLNPECREPGYLLGRLFAVLERTQAEAINNPNATIRDRYFGSASATPCAVFPVLLRLVQHHIAKAEYGGIRDREIGEIVERIAEFPKRLSLEQQGMFALGYYHQRNKR